jgi:hypothetical protein
MREKEIIILVAEQQRFCHKAAWTAGSPLGYQSK